MNFNNAGVAKQIVTLPRTFHSLGNVSIFALLEATGYFKLHDQISEADIRAAFCAARNVFKDGCSTRKTNEPRAAGMLP
jgi:hypothetical protein